MKKLLFALTTVSLNAFSYSYQSHVDEVKATRPKDSKKIENISKFAFDLNLHYEAAIILGTSENYVTRANIELFDDMLDAADTQCTEEINLNGCLMDLLCKGQIRNNFHRPNFESNCKC